MRWSAHARGRLSWSRRTVSLSPASASDSAVSTGPVTTFQPIWWGNHRLSDGRRAGPGALWQGLTDHERESGSPGGSPLLAFPPVPPPRHQSIPVNKRSAGGARPLQTSPTASHPPSYPYFLVLLAQACGLKCQDLFRGKYLSECHGERAGDRESWVKVLFSLSSPSFTVRARSCRH